MAGPAPAARIHECTVCGGRGPWSDKWCWYGSYRDFEAGRPIVELCSENCRHGAVARGLVPRDAKKIDE